MGDTAIVPILWILKFQTYHSVSYPGFMVVDKFPTEFLRNLIGVHVFFQLIHSRKHCDLPTLRGIFGKFKNSSLLEVLSTSKPFFSLGNTADQNEKPEKYLVFSTSETVFRSEIDSKK